jgi:hypothetical protein
MKGRVQRAGWGGEAIEFAMFAGQEAGYLTK